MSKLSQTDSGLFVVKEEEDPFKRPPKSIKIWNITTGYNREVSKFITAIEQQGGIICGVLLVDRYNHWGDEMGHEYAVIYQAEKELSIEQWT